MPGDSYRRRHSQSGNHSMLTTNQIFFPPPPFGHQVFPVNIRRKVTPMEHQHYIASLNSKDFHTVHKEVYDGWDPSNYHQPKPVPLKDEITNMVGNSSAKFDDSTVTKISYPPPPKTSKVAKGKQPTSKFRVPEEKFQDITTNKHFFKNWGVQPRVRHGDIHEGSHLKSMLPFESLTTTKSTYMPTITKKVKKFKPSCRGINIEGTQDFSTVYRETYRPLQLPSCPSHTHLIQNQDKETPNRNRETTKLT